MNPKDLLEKIKAGDRRALSKAITLVESTKHDHRQFVKTFFRDLNWQPPCTRRIAISGPPGVGKSTFIETIGTRMIEDGHRLAVLAIDPSSQETMGSILADKTRMLKLSRDERAYIRPSPAGTILGGVTRRTRECMTLCEIAGYDTILIETVGVGQSETTAHSMVDLFLTLQLPGAGDDLQGMKKGIIERSDIIVVNKSDQHPASLLSKTISDLKSAKQLLNHPKLWQTPIVACSASKGIGIPEISEFIDGFFEFQKKRGLYSTNRKSQNLKWFEHELSLSIYDHLNLDQNFHSATEILKERINHQNLTALEAIEQLLKHIKYQSEGISS